MVYGDVHPSRSVFTIHNMEFGVDQIGRAVAAADVSTTVSPTYAMEVPPSLRARQPSRCVTQQESVHSNLVAESFLRRLTYGFEWLTSALQGQRPTK